MIKDYIVNVNFDNSRLDKWFKKNVSDVPQSLIEKSIRKGRIKVNNKKRKSSYKLKTNDKVTIFNINFSQKKNLKNKEKYKPSKKELSFSSSLIIENNTNFVVLNKPAGIAVQSGTKSRKNIMDILIKTKEFIGFTPYSVHRIDKETTGILLVAKNRQYAQLLTSLFRIRKIHKTYIAIVIGTMEKKKGTYTDDLLYYEGDKKIWNKAITHYQVLDSNYNYSLLKLNPQTGRKHQLRRQLLNHGHPILGDSKYRITENRVNKKSHLMLHAFKINFSIDGIKYNFSANPPLEFKNFLSEKFLKIF